MNAARICGYLWTAFAVIWLLWAISTKRTLTRESFRSRIPYLLFTVAAFFMMFGHDETFAWMRWRILPRDRWLSDIGIALTAAGLLFAIWARAYIGRNWSGNVTVKVGHELIRSGPYRWVRHPIYSGIILALIGTAINRGQLRGLIAVLLLWVGFTLKSRLEERFMIATFGQEYEEFRRTTGGMIPRLRL